MLQNLSIRLSLGLSATIALVACASVPDEELITPLADAEEAVEAARDEIEDAPDAPEVTLDEVALLKESVFVAAAIPTDVPGDFTGCYEDALACFVDGNQVDVAVRYEPQSGRFWFLDPTSGNTFYADGSIRTTNAFQPKVAALVDEPEVEISQPAEDTPDVTSTDAVAEPTDET